MRGQTNLDPLCGVYSVYAAAKSLGRSPDLADLVRPEFVSRQQGSTAADLQEAAAAVGLHSAAVAGLDPIDLRRADWPLVLHVRSTPLATAYDHWVTLLRVDGDQAVVADVTRIAAGFTHVGPTLVRTSSGGPDVNKRGVIARMPLSRLLAHWDGIAVAVSDAPITAAEVMSASAWRTHAGLLAAALALVGVAWFRRKKGVAQGEGLRPLGRARAGLLTAARAVVIVSLAVGLALLHHLFADRGLLADPSVGREVELWHTSAFLPRRSLADVKRAADDGSSALIIDARDAASFAEGHIPHAINVPATWILYTPGRLLPAFVANRSREIIVYCIDEHCGAAALVAQRLKFEGASHVSLYEPGYVEWQGQAKGS